MIDPSATLADIGELRLIDEILLPLARHYDSYTSAGDDCSYIPAEGEYLAVTADVGPKPLLQSLPGYENDFEAAGWLSVVTTASDIATAGAKPLFLTNCVDAPATLRVAEFASFMTGYFKASAAFGFKNGGGDVRHGAALAIRVFGAGVVDGAKRIGRGGARAGDHLILLGSPGEFMATYLLAATGSTDVLLGNRLRPEAEAVLRTPRPQLTQMQCLGDESLIVAASDTSDGLLGAIDNIARSSRTGFQLHLSENMLLSPVKRAAAVRQLNPWNIFFAWGDWAVAAVVGSSKFERFQQVCEEKEIAWRLLGVATAYSRVIEAQIDNSPPSRVRILRNENFVSLSFNAGLQGHLDYILKTPLFSSAVFDEHP